MSTPVNNTAASPKSETLESLQENIKELFQGKFKFFESRCEDLIVKSDTTLNSQIKHLQGELRSKDEIIKLWLY